MAPTENRLPNPFDLTNSRTELLAEFKGVPMIHPKTLRLLSMSMVLACLLILAVWRLGFATTAPIVNFVEAEAAGAIER